MPGVKVLIKGLNKVIDFPVGSKMDDIGKHIQGNWSSVEEMSGLPMDAVSRKERAQYLGFSLPAVGALSMLAPEEVEASFLGQGAKKAALDMLGMAKKMEGSKIDADEIWQKTGWGKGADNKWRFEVDDSTSKIIGDDRNYNQELMDTFSPDGGGAAKRKQIITERNSYKAPHEETNLLSEVLDHPNLYEQYPDLESAVYKRKNQLNLGEAYYNEPLDEIGMSGTNREATKSPLAHETQHAIQAREGFAKGGNVNEFERGEVSLITSRTEQLRNEVDSVLGSEAYKNEKAALRLEGKPRHEVNAILAERYGINEKVDEIYKQEEKLGQLTSFQKYESLAGETEARNVQTRLNMTQEERRLTPPWKTEDVPRGEQIVKYGGAGAAVGVAALSPEQAQAHQQAQKSFIDSMLSDQSLESLPSFTTATAPGIDQQKLPQQYRADVGGFQAPVAPLVNQFGHAIGGYELPIIGDPVEGLSNYLINFGYDDPAAERLKRAAMAGLDVI